MINVIIQADDVENTLKKLFPKAGTDTPVEIELTEAIIKRRQTGSKTSSQGARESDSGAVDWSKMKPYLTRLLRDSLEEAKPPRLVVRTPEGLSFIGLDEILFVEKQGKKAFIHTKKNIWETCHTLHGLSQFLPEHFFRSHRSFIINLKQVQRIRKLNQRTYETFFEDSKDTALISNRSFNEIVELVSPGSRPLMD